jgi:hypothetical protein
MSMIVLAYAATIFEDLKKDLADRLEMVEDGKERLMELSEKTDRLLQDVRLTIPENQRMNLQNTASDFEIRLSPKLTPYKTNIIMQKDEFKELVDIARTKCRECTEDDESCEACELFQLLTVLLPLEEYDGMLCPYNLGEWGS